MNDQYELSMHLFTGYIVIDNFYKISKNVNVYI